MKITKAIIPVAGIGTRFLPATKAIPKEMLPVLDKPTVQYIVEEAVASGIKHIIFIISDDKEAIKNHFSPNPRLESKLKKAQKNELLKKVKKISRLAKFSYAFQDIYKFYGNGAAVLCAKSFIKNEPFVVLWGDEIVDSRIPRLKQLISAFEKYQNPIIAAFGTDDEGTKKYGIVAGEKVDNRVIKLETIIEKPGPKKAPSRICARSSYLLTPDIIPILEKTPRGKSNEYWLVDAIFKLMKKRPVYAYKVQGEIYDIGNAFSWLKTNVEFGLKHPSFKREFKQYLKNLKT